MSIILLPSSLAIGSPFAIEQRRYELDETSDATGDSSVRLQAPPRWALSIVSPEHVSLDAADVWTSLLLQLDGRINTLAAWDVARPVPRGTARGSLALSAPAAAGVTSISISGAEPANGTLRAGDWLQVGTGLGSSQLIKLVAPATLAGGAGTIVFKAPLRRAYAAGTPVTWDRPLGYFVLAPAAGVSLGQYVTRRHVRGFSIDALERFG